MLAILDRVSSACAALAAWLLFAVGGMILWEVGARYLFNAPTIWAEELSRFFQLWAVYLATAALLRDDTHIRITLVTDRFGDQTRRWLDVLSLSIIAAFCLIPIWYGWEITADSLAVGRTSSTMLDVPSWLTEIAIPAGSALLLLQALSQIARRIGGAVPPRQQPGGH